MLTSSGGAVKFSNSMSDEDELEVMEVLAEDRHPSVLSLPFS